VPSEWIACEACGRRRFRPETLAVEVPLADGVRRSVADVFDLSVDEAPAAPRRRVGRRGSSRRSGPVGLGYLRLGQGSPSLSGGEAQRIKLAKQLATARPGDLVVLDEPTTGLHPADVAQLIGALRELVDAGSTVVVVEHQPDLVAAADWLVRLGPGGGPDGGRLVFAGVPRDDVAREPPARPRAAPRQPAAGEPRDPDRPGDREQPPERVGPDREERHHGGRRRVGLGQVVARPRCPRGGGAAALRRVALDVRAAVRSRRAGGAGRPHRGPGARRSRSAPTAASGRR
jgi:hypothetical protein